MRGIADAEKSAARPLAQAIHGDGKQLDVVPVLYFAEAFAQEWRDARDFLLKTCEPFLANGVEAAFGDYVGALPVFVAVERYEDLPCPETAESLIRIVWLARDAHPQHVNGRAKVEHFEAGLFTDDRAAAVCPDGQIGAHVQNAVLRFGTDTCDATICDEQVGGFDFHAQMKSGIGL